jgi:predicted nucleic acid-binding protein
MEDLGAQIAETWYWRILNSDFIIIDDITPPIGIQSGKLKVKYKNTLSIVDSISLAMASELNCALLTTDGGLKSIKERTRIIHFEV